MKTKKKESKKKKNRFVLGKFIKLRVKEKRKKKVDSGTIVSNRYIHMKTNMAPLLKVHSCMYKSGTTASNEWTVINDQTIYLKKKI